MPESISKNQSLLESFTQYCNEHSEERFWQALCNWSGCLIWSGGANGIKDTFYWEGKDK